MTTDARAFAIITHGKQQYGQQPYVVHLDAVVAILKDHGIDDPELQAAAYLHDTLEDTPLDEAVLLKLFGEQVTRIVQFCSDEPGRNRRTRKALTYARIRAEIDRCLAQGGEPAVQILDAIHVKLADRLANIRQSVLNNGALLDMYRREREAFWNALKVPVTHLTLPMIDMWEECDELLGEADPC